MFKTPKIYCSTLPEACNLRSRQNAPRVRTAANLISPIRRYLASLYKVESLSGGLHHKMRNVTGMSLTPCPLLRVSPSLRIVYRRSFSYRAEKFSQSLEFFFVAQIRECVISVVFAPICHVKMRIFHFYKSRARTNAYLVQVRETMRYKCTAPHGRSYLSYLSTVPTRKSIEIHVLLFLTKSRLL